MTDRSVRRRQVFYISGFDPKGASYYHALYKNEALKLTGAAGFRIEEVGPRVRLAGGNSSWRVSATDQGNTVNTDYEFMAWDHVVRRHWPRSNMMLWMQIVSTTWFNVRHGSLWAMYKLSWPPAVALFAPFLLLVAAFSGVLLLVLDGIALALLAKPWWMGLLVSLGGSLAWLVICRALEIKYSMYWMMRSYAFTAKQARGEIDGLEACLDKQAERLARALMEPADEVLVVAHSSGSIMAAIIVSRALNIASQGHNAASEATVSLLTLGQWIPLLGLLPMAQSFRSNLQHLADSAQVRWIDFSAPPDGCCFALTDPLQSCRLPRSAASRDRFKLLNPRFIEMHGLQTYQKLKRDKFALHFQYLCAPSQSTEYNYFAITGGGVSLWDRFIDRVSVDGFSDLKPSWMKS